MCKNNAGQEKITGNSEFFFPRHARKTLIFSSKKWINTMDFVYFLDKKQTLDNFFFIQGELERILNKIFSSNKEKKTLVRAR